MIEEPLKTGDIYEGCQVWSFIDFLNAHPEIDESLAGFREVAIGQLFKSAPTPFLEKR